MSGKSKRPHGVVQSVRRFFWLPRGTPRDPAQPVSLLLVWLFLLAVGAGGAALGLEWEGTFAMTMGTVFTLLDDVIKGVRHRWPACVAALAVGWGVVRLAHVVVPGASDSLWGDYGVHAAWTLATLATFVAITRLPPRPR
ncbi:hypothetical protein [Streptomyces bicolor]|uniref:hypothetical protein n=1 Tax=Streptomyces bicolor TaxID=66874 RepID=UPI0004E163E1|nr:hypothetical protein [Streptomyces bicolor]